MSPLDILKRKRSRNNRLQPHGSGSSATTTHVKRSAFASIGSESRTGLGTDSASRSFYGSRRSRGSIESSGLEYGQPGRKEARHMMRERSNLSFDIAFSGNKPIDEIYISISEGPKEVKVSARG